jgi:hypothetical protein
MGTANNVPSSYRSHRTRTCLCEHVIMSRFLLYPSAIEDKTKNVLDVAVSDSPVCFAPIVELIVPILPRSGDGYAACLYLVGLKWHPHGFLHDSDHSSCPLARRRLCFQASALFSHISSAVIDRGASITMFLMT